MSNAIKNRCDFRSKLAKFASWDLNFISSFIFGLLFYVRRLTFWCFLNSNELLMFVSVVSFSCHFVTDNYWCFSLRWISGGLTISISYWVPYMCYNFPQTIQNPIPKLDSSFESVSLLRSRIWPSGWMGRECLTSKMSCDVVYLAQRLYAW
jgi:hypothetical protein